MHESPYIRGRSYVHSPWVWSAPITALSSWIQRSNILRSLSPGITKPSVSSLWNPITVLWRNLSSQVEKPMWQKLKTSSKQAPLSSHVTANTNLEPSWKWIPSLSQANLTSVMWSIDELLHWTLFKLQNHKQINDYCFNLLNIGVTTYTAIEN